MWRLVLGALAVLSWAACGGEGEPEPGFDPCGPPPLAHDWFDGQTLVWNATGGQCARIERTRVILDEDTICKACPFDLHRMVVHDGTTTRDVIDPDQLTYTPSHHNWADEAALSDGSVGFVVRFGPEYAGLGDVLERYDDGVLTESWPLEASALYTPGDGDDDVQLVEQSVTLSD